MEHINRFKMGLAALFAALTALWGWFGWLILIWLFLMLLDYITGSAAAIKGGKWSSSVAREGIFHKGAELIVVIAAGVLDFVVWLLLENLPALALPLPYAALACPMVVTWYVLTELGSILENSGKLGGPQPIWFQKAVAMLKTTVEQSGGAESE